MALQRRHIKWAAVLTLALLVGSVALALAMPVEDPPAPSERASELYADLSAGGVEDAVVTVSGDRMFVRYNHPPGTGVNESRLFVLRRAAAVAPETSTVVVQVYMDYEPHQEITVSTETVQGYNLGAVPYSELEAVMRVETAP